MGALLRLAHQTVTAELYDGLAAAGHAAVHPPHFAITQPLWDRPDGARLTELAAAARITKQSAGALVDQLEAAGYVERFADAADQRARRVRFTRKGWAFGKRARLLVRRIEARWIRRLGAARVATLRETLQLLVGDAGR